MPVPSSGMPAPLGLNATLHQVGVIVRDLEQGMARYRDLLGLGPFMTMRTNYEARFHDWRGTVANHNAFAKWGDLYLEMVEPGIGEGVHRHWLETRGEGIFHLGFWTDDMSQRPGGAAVCFESMGAVNPDGSARIIMLDTLDELGWYIELGDREMVEGLNTMIDKYMAEQAAG